MRIKRLLQLLFVALLICMIKVDVNATFEQDLGKINQQGQRVLDDNSGYGMALKISGVYGSVICTEYYKSSPAGSGDSCTLTDDWTPQIRAGVAAIISDASAKLSDEEMTNEYFAAELAINRFLYSKEVGGAELKGAHNLSSQYLTLYNKYLNLANEAYDNYSLPTLELSTQQLTFTKQGNNFVSNSITVTTNVDSYSVNTNKGNIVKNGNTFSISIPESQIGLGTTSISVSIVVSKTNYEARNYNCGSEYQTLTPNHIESVVNSKNAIATGTIENESKLSITKVDENNNPLVGATLQILNNSGSVLYQWNTTEEPYYIEGLNSGTYTLRETEAPDGYKKLNQDIKFQMSSIGTITLVTNSSSVKLVGTNITLSNEKISISITKVDKNSNPLVGATLQILDNQGNEIKDDEGNILYKWVSTKDPYYIEGLEAGTYFLREIEAPDGYELLDNDIEFEISLTGVITIKNEITDVESEESGLILFNLAKTKLLISKQDITNSKELPGATLQILDSQGNEIKDDEGNILYKWVSTKDPYYIEGLPAGKYILVEISSPDGYVLNEEKIEFELKNNNEVVSVTMKNTPIVEVPATGFNTSLFIISIGIISIISGSIFIGLNVKRQNQ